MSEYKELVESLRGYSTEVVSYKIDGAFAYAVTAAADAIDQLSTKCRQLEKERDALIRDLETYGRVCRICRELDSCYSKCPRMNPKCDTIHNENWKWRGVQEDNDERT